MPRVDLKGAFIMAINTTNQRLDHNQAIQQQCPRKIAGQAVEHRQHGQATKHLEKEVLEDVKVS